MAQTQRVRRKKPKQRFGSKHAKPRGIDKRGISDRAWKLIEEGWSFGWPDTKCCDYAKITIGKLRVAYEKDPQLREKRDLIKESPTFYAQKNVTEALKDGDIQTTRWFMERRVEGFGQKGQIDINVSHTLDEVQILDKLSRFIPDNALKQLEHHDQQDVIDITPVDDGVEMQLADLLK